MSGCIPPIIRSTGDQNAAMENMLKSFRAETIAVEGAT